MKDWKAIARASVPELPAGEIDRTVAPLEALEQTFRPLVKDLPPGLEPDFAFRADEEGE